MQVRVLSRAPHLNRANAILAAAVHRRADAICELLNDRGHNAVHVRDRGVDARPDAEVVAVAAAEERVIVTENVKDFAGVHGVTVVCVPRSRLPPQGMHVHLAELLDKWALAHPEPYVGLH